MTGSWKLRRALAVGVAAGLLLALGSASAEATTIIRTGTSGSLKAWVRFEQAGTGADIFVTLANISSADVTLNTQILTGVFFNLNGSSALTKSTAQLADQVNSSGVPLTTDSFAFNCSGAAGVGKMACPSPNSTGGNIGGEWAYRFDSAGLNTGNGVTQQHGIGGSNLSGTFGSGDVFDAGAELGGSAGAGGVDYGLTSFGDDTITNPGGTPPLLLNAGVFRFIVGATYALTSVTEVRFQYGSSPSEPEIDVPLPPALMLLSSGLLGIAAVLQARRRRRTPSGS
jgi:hypothetical protein